MNGNSTIFYILGVNPIFMNEVLDFWDFYEGVKFLGIFMKSRFL